MSWLSPLVVVTWRWLTRAGRDDRRRRAARRRDRRAATARRAVHAGRCRWRCGSPTCSRSPAGFRYDLRYMAFGPGEHDIGKSLAAARRHAARSRGASSSSRSIALIPENYSGELYETPTVADRSAHELHAADAAGVGSVGAAAGAAGVVRAQATPPRGPAAAAAERRPSVCGCCWNKPPSENLTAEQQADLEQLLLAFWSQRLSLSDAALSEAIEQLRRHPQAGAQWSRVERWLHSRATATNGAVAKELLSDLKALK